MDNKNQTKASVNSPAFIKYIKQLRADAEKTTPRHKQQTYYGLTPCKASAVLYLYNKRNINMSQLARFFGVSRTTIHDVIHEKTYKACVAVGNRFTRLYITGAVESGE